MICPTQKLFFTTGAILGFLAFAAGAFGSHILKERLNPSELATFEIGVRYQMYHSLALLLLAASMLSFSSPLMCWSGFLFIIGTLIFSGSLYILVLSGTKWWGAITPIGGIVLLIAWIFLILGSLLSTKPL